mmetsp:Transcript_31809/g.70655  ORF Transcript_31809/g.70655 Transcript_31809/m.70655 type:complete len:449 (+) Transcript_31809:45-1391(+)
MASPLHLRLNPLYVVIVILVYPCVAGHRLLQYNSLSALDIQKWNHYPKDYPWWPEFATYVYNSKLFDPNYIKETTEKDPLKFKNDVYQMLVETSKYVARSIDYPLTNLTRPQPLRVDCKKPEYASMLSGEVRSAPVKVAMVIHMMAELHLLRLRFHMYDDMVDFFIITEGTTGQHSHIRKPLIFENNKHRFGPFLKKVLHIVYDDRMMNDFFAAVTHMRASEDFSGEKAERLVAYNHLIKMKELGDQDLIVYGDADEFADEDFIFQLKHCELKSNAKTPFSSNSPFFQQDFRYPFRTDWPPSTSFPYSFKFPSIWAAGELRKADPAVMRHHLISGAYPSRAGGFHLSSDPFIPNLMFKYINNAEGGLWFFRQERGLGNKNITKMYESYRVGLEGWRNRIASAKCVREKFGPTAVEVPWIVRQNPSAFPWMFLNERAWYEGDATKMSCW